MTSASKAVIADLGTWLTPAVIAAVVSGIVSLAAGSLAAMQASSDRRREMFADAYRAYKSYCELPYMVYRRRHDKPEEERARLADEGRVVQERVGFYEAWTQTEGKAVGEAYAELMSAARRVAGSAITAAWQRPPISSDGEVPVGKAIDLSSLLGPEQAYLGAVQRRCHPLRSRLGQR